MNIISETYFSKTFWVPLIPFVSFMLYATAGPIIPQQSFLSYFLLAIFLFYASYSMYRMKWDDVSKSIFLFVFVQFIYFLFAPSFIYSMDGDYKETLGKFNAIVINFLPFFLAYYTLYGGTSFYWCS